MIAARLCIDAVPCFAHVIRDRPSVAFHRNSSELYVAPEVLGGIFQVTAAVAYARFSSNKEQSAFDIVLLNMNEFKKRLLTFDVVYIVLSHCLHFSIVFYVYLSSILEYRQEMEKKKQRAASYFALLPIFCGDFVQVQCSTNADTLSY